MWWTHAILLCLPRDVNHLFVLHPHAVDALPISHSVSIVSVSQACVHVTLTSQSGPVWRCFSPWGTNHMSAHGHTECNGDTLPVKSGGCAAQQESFLRWEHCLWGAARDSWSSQLLRTRQLRGRSQPEQPIPKQCTMSNYGVLSSSASHSSFSRVLLPPNSFIWLWLQHAVAQTTLPWVSYVPSSLRLGVAMLIPDKVDLKTKTVTRVQEECHVWCRDQSNKRMYSAVNIDSVSTGAPQHKANIHRMRERSRVRQS